MDNMRAGRAPVALVDVEGLLRARHAQLNAVGSGGQRGQPDRQAIGVAVDEGTVAGSKYRAAGERTQAERDEEERPPWARSPHGTIRWRGQGESMQLPLDYGSVLKSAGSSRIDTGA